jgi:hypothetical protein
MHSLPLFSSPIGVPALEHYMTNNRCKSINNHLFVRQDLTDVYLPKKNRTRKSHVKVGLQKPLSTDFCRYCKKTRAQVEAKVKVNV